MSWSAYHLAEELARKAQEQLMTDCHPDFVQYVESVKVMSEELMARIAPFLMDHNVSQTELSE